MFAREAPCAKALEEATLRVEVSPQPQGAQLALGLVHQGNGIHYPVGPPLLGDSLTFLLTSVADKELLRASKALGAVHVNVQRSYGTQQCQGWVKIFVMTQQAEPSIWVKK